MPSIHEQIKNSLIPANERAGFKGKKIAELVGNVPRTNVKFSGSEYDIEVVSAKAIPNGIEVLARAWSSDGRQIGFGEDGSIDLERFRIFDPRILADNPAGDIITEWTDREGYKVRRLEENLQSALLQTLLRIVRNHHRFDDSKIVKDKTGNTISTFFSNVTGDGHVNNPNNATWAGARNAASATSIDTAVTIQVGAEDELNGTKYAVSRGFLPFDTSSIPDTDPINTVKLEIIRNGGENSQTSGLILTTQGNPGDLVDADFSALTLDSPAEGTDARVDTNVANEATITYNFNATGRGWINKTGFTKLGIRFTGDIDNVTPPNSTRRYVLAYSADEAGTTKDPLLTIDHGPLTSIEFAVRNLLVPNLFHRKAATNNY